MSIVRSFRIMVGTVKQLVVMYAVLLAGTLVLGVVYKFAGSSDLGLALSTAVPFVSVLYSAVIVLVTASAVFNMNYPAAIGYKYYHSLPASAELFQNSVILMNVFSFVMIEAYLIILAVFFGAWSMLLAAGSTLLAMGLMNFLGYAKSPYVRMLPFIIAGSLTGAFMTGLAVGDAPELGGFAIAVIEAICVVIFAAGMMYAILRAKSAWERG